MSREGGSQGEKLSPRPARNARLARRSCEKEKEKGKAGRPRRFSQLDAAARAKKPNALPLATHTHTRARAREKDERKQSQSRAQAAFLSLSLSLSLSLFAWVCPSFLLCFLLFGFCVGKQAPKKPKRPKLKENLRALLTQEICFHTRRFHSH